MNYIFTRSTCGAEIINIQVYTGKVEITTAEIWYMIC